MDEVICVIIALGVFTIIMNVSWFVMLMRNNDQWLDRVLNISDRQLNNYKELLEDIVNGGDKKDEGDNVL